MKTVPTLLTTNIEEFEEQMGVFQKYYQRIQIDIADGKLVPNVTTSINEILQLITLNSKLVHPSTIIDFHLMVEDYQSALSQIARLQEMNIKVNLALINANHRPDIGALSRTYGFSIGLDVFPLTQIDDIAHQYSIKDIPAFQIMTVNPGFQGSPFLEEMLMKIQQLREHDYTAEILIDGGVNDQTIPVISSRVYQPNILCIGSFLTKSGEKLGDRVEELKKLE